MNLLGVLTATTVRGDVCLECGSRKIRIHTTTSLRYTFLGLVGLFLKSQTRREKMPKCYYVGQLKLVFFYFLLDTFSNVLQKAI